MARAVGIDLGTTNSVVAVLDGGFPTFKYGDDGVGSSEVNADCTSHDAISSS